MILLKKLSKFIKDIKMNKFRENQSTFTTIKEFIEAIAKLLKKKIKNNFIIIDLVLFVFIIG